MRAAQGRRIDLLLSILGGMSEDELRTLDAAATLLEAAVRRHLGAATGGATRPD
jgi:hypothetical protein